MFKKVNVPLLGLVSNMSIFTCPSCGSAHSIFGSTKTLLQRCQEYDMELLGEIPLHSSICDDADRGKPTVVSEPESGRSISFQDIARKVESTLKL
jgi:ATP-binding protein involved in chromosome partitioning